MPEDSTHGSKRPTQQSEREANTADGEPNTRNGNAPDTGESGNAPDTGESPTDGTDETQGTSGSDTAVAITKRGFLAGTSAVIGAGFLSDEGSVSARAQTDDGDRDASNAESENGMVASSHASATEIGVTVLENGGNAVDAAVAVQFALNVVQPHTSGIGGGGFTLVYRAATDEMYAIDNRERAPLGATEDMFLDESGDEVDFQARRTNGKSVGVPGTLRAAEILLKEFGSTERADLVEPAVELARDGVEVDSFLAESIAENHELHSFNDAAATVFTPNGDPLEQGDDLVQEDLAETLELIAEDGSEAFYQGAIGEDLVETVQGLARRRKRGGNMSTQDLGRYNVERTLPTVGQFEGAAESVTVRTMSLPSSGGLTIAQILQLLEPLELADLDRRSVEAYHLIAEASSLAFVDRIAYLGDDEFVDPPSQGFLDEAYVDQRRDLIDPSTARESYDPGDPFAHQPGESYRVAARDVERFKHLANASGRSNDSLTTSVSNRGQTTHFTTADSEGNLVSWTSTIEQLFGSGNMVQGRGFMLNNELTDFDSEPGGPNEVQPEKRPMSSTSPTIVFRDGDPFFTIGSPGGFTIITTVSQVILNVAEFGMDLQAAIEEPRIFSFGDGRLFVEETIPEETRSGLEDLGHEIVDSGKLGNAQGIMRTDDGYVGVGDPRRDSSAQGL